MSKYFEMKEFRISTQRLTWLTNSDMYNISEPDRHVFAGDVLFPAGEKACLAGSQRGYS